MSAACRNAAGPAPAPNRSSHSPSSERSASYCRRNATASPSAGSTRVCTVRTASLTMSALGGPRGRAVPGERGVSRAGAESVEPLAELRAERVVLPAQRDGFTERRLDARVHRPDRVVDDVGAERAERAERARRARDEDRRDPDLAGDERADHG